MGTCRRNRIHFDSTGGLYPGRWLPLWWAGCRSCTGSGLLLEYAANAVIFAVFLKPILAASKAINREYANE